MLRAFSRFGCRRMRSECAVRMMKKVLNTRDMEEGRASRNEKRLAAYCVVRSHAHHSRHPQGASEDGLFLGLSLVCRRRDVSVQTGNMLFPDVSSVSVLFRASIQIYLA